MPPYHEGTFEGAIKEFTARSPGLHTTHPRKERALVGEKDFRRKSTREGGKKRHYANTEARKRSRSFNESRLIGAARAPIMHTFLNERLESDRALLVRFVYFAVHLYRGFISMIRVTCDGREAGESSSWKGKESRCLPE